jgi:hypothetical protein
MYGEIPKNQITLKNFSEHVSWNYHATGFISIYIRPRKVMGKSGTSITSKSIKACLFHQLFAGFDFLSALLKEHLKERLKEQYSQFFLWINSEEVKIS